MAEMLTQSQRHDFTKAFSLFDYDKDGVISIDDMRIVLKSLGHKISDQELDDLIKSIDRNGDGKIELAEFLDMMGAKQQSIKAVEEEVRIAFEFFDLDGNGYISMTELKQVALELGEELTESEIDEMIREADVDGDGQVDYNEFLRMMMYDGSGLS
ncbi:uncharacterized protein LOC135681595 isoform X1 [Rhopilema esculentum]|uniref:uncharacterized protein LOC135681595 isoform X1 n=2 Tax=Rhopilema esculentum TaxID=499914 RepID=UPI0031E425EE